MSKSFDNAIRMFPANPALPLLHGRCPNDMVACIDALGFGTPMFTCAIEICLAVVERTADFIDDLANVNANVARNGITPDSYLQEGVGRGAKRDGTIPF